MVPPNSLFTLGILVSLCDFKEVATYISRQCTAQKTKFSIKDFFSKCDQIRRFFADLVTFTEEILNGKLCFFVY